MTRYVRTARVRGGALAAALLLAALLAAPAAEARKANMVIVTNPALVGVRVHFDGSTSQGLTIQIGCPSGIDWYHWDLDGDGVTDATGKSVDHTYYAAGSYRVSLTVGVDAEWCSTDTETQTLTVLRP